MPEPKSKFSISQYSTLTVSFLSISSLASSQSLYVDIDPDIEAHDDGFYETLDIDMDGDTELTFAFGTGYDYGGDEFFEIRPEGPIEMAYHMETQEVVVNGCTSSIFSTTYTAIDRITPMFNVGDTINSDFDFTNEDVKVFNDKAAGSYYCLENFFLGEAMGTNEHYVGFRMWNAGEPYYGWLRFQVEYDAAHEYRHVNIMDYAIQQEPYTPIVAGCTEFYEDLDGDGFGAGDLAYICGGVGNNSDCDDTQILYQDADGDGFGCESYIVACGGVTNYLDCDDESLRYTDGDGDGYGGETLVACGGVSNSDDCDDTNELVYLPITYYADTDADGFGDPTITILHCDGDPPAGYVDNMDDCDDTNAFIHYPITYYADSDADGFGDATNIILQCDVIPPIGYVNNPDDCDDANELVHFPITYYADTDADGFGDIANTTLHCDVTPPTGYVDNTIDCDDTNGAVDHPLLYFADTDGDGFGDPLTGILLCTLSPMGYVENNGDCDDMNAFINTPILYYQDADDDGFGNVDSTALICSLSPTGYVVNGADCIDLNAEINVGAIEILNGIDDNCNGEIDEGFVGINTIEQTAFKIYPNPTNAEITIEITNGSALEKQIIITDALQKVVMMTSTTENKITLDVSHLASGIYFISIETETGFGLQKFVKE